MKQMLDRRLIGTPIGSVTSLAEVGQMRLFAKATGQTNPIFFSKQAACAAGYRSIVAPPTFVHALYELGTEQPSTFRDTMGFKLEDTLHGEQAFDYYRLICAGDELRFEGSVTDIYEKKGGTLTFVVQEALATNQLNEDVARIRTVTIVVAR
jgi:acyl dehydratase